MTVSSQDSLDTHDLGGKYRVLAELGQGGTANVTLAMVRGPNGFKKLVVLKMMKSNLADEAEFSQMFMSEARLAARLNHPNIVQTNEVFEHEGRPVIVMEYLEGQPLSHVLARARGSERFPLGMRLRVISDVLAGLQYAHDLRDFDGTPLGVVHRDISPQNVFVTFDGHVKLLDFGIAKLAISPVETATGVIKGKVRYLSPEQIAGGAVDRRADVFAIGVMLWEIATDSRMWAGMREATIIDRLMRGSIPPPTSANSAVDPELERIIMKALERNPEGRYETAAALQEELDNFVASLGTSVRHRDLGVIVASLFEDVRTKTRDVIEMQLTKVASLTDEEYAEIKPLGLMGAQVSTQSGSKTVADVSASQGAPFPLSRHKALALAGGFLLLSLVALAALRPKSAAAPGEALPKPAPAVDSNKVVVTPATVQLRMTAFPATAKLYLDDQLLASNPSTQQVPRSEALHKLRVEAVGHTAQSREISFREDQDIVVTLERREEQPSAAQKPPVWRSPPATPAAPSKAKPAARTDCDPPFVVDARGVKRYKPDCI